MIIHYKKIILCCFCLCFFCNSYANYTSGQVKSILEDALHLQETRTFTAVQEDDKLDIQISQRQNSDGSTYYRKESITQNGILKKPSIVLVNAKGSFYISSISGQYAIKRDYHDVNAFEWYYIYDQYASYAMKEITYNDMPCYVIQKKVPFDDFYYSLYMQFAKNNFQTLPKWIGKKSFKAGFPNVMLFYIGKDNKFIYTIKVYNPSGKLLIELNYKNVVINPIIKDSVFTLPSNVTVRPVSSREDYIDVSTEIVKQTAPDTIKEIRKTHKKELRAYQLIN